MLRGPEPEYRACGCVLPRVKHGAEVALITHKRRGDVPRRVGGWMPVELGLLEQHRLFERGEIRRRLDPQGVTEEQAKTRVRAQGIRLPTGAVQAEHELRPQVLTQRMLGDQGFQFWDERDVLAEGQTRIVERLDRIDADRVEAGGFGMRPRRVLEVNERR